MARRKPTEQPQHDCPPWCHRCPDMDGEVMPTCWAGVVAWHLGTKEVLAACACERPPRNRFRAWVKRTNERLARIEARLDAADAIERGEHRR